MSSKSRNFWAADWFTGVVFTLIFLLGMYQLARGFFYEIETAAYDKAMAMAPLHPSVHVAVVDIDENSLDNMGRWPWSRDTLGSVIELLAAGGARLIAVPILFSESEIDDGVAEIESLAGFFRDSSLATAAAGNDTVGQDLRALDNMMTESIGRLNYDTLLADNLRTAGNVILSLEIQPGIPVGSAPQALPDYVQKSALSNITAAVGAVSPLKSISLLAPVAILGEQAAGTGVATIFPDQDGIVRYEALVVDHYGSYLPSFALTVASQFLKVSPENIQVEPGKGLRFGNIFIQTTADLRLLTSFHSSQDGSPPFIRDSFWDVFTGLVPASKFRDKIVIIGPSARGVGGTLTTPVAETEAPVMVLANTVSSLLQRDFYTRPAWTGSVELLLMLLLAAYLVIVLPRLRVGIAAGVTSLILLSLIGGEFLFLLGEGIWLQLMAPALFLALGHLVMTIKLSRVTERLRLRSDADSAESNKMLGLAFQSQGQLDMAFDKFRKCPVDDAMSEVLYNLALDFERKRQFSKAGAAFGMIHDYDPDYRDIAARIKRSHSLDNTVMLGMGSGSRPPSLLLSEDGMSSPMLGRYVVDKEIGKGAMGTVYLGRDPKINRVVAIKTIALSEEFDEDELASAKERFFREAESAGRLNHPDIVTVYDAGEEHDLAYIAMEFLKGDHLNGHTRPDALLQTDQVLQIVSRAADALDYAHKEGVIHRDIKPANIMYDPVTNEVKITDFGVARITDSSKTKTGIVLGTPSYMSPEQLSGQNVTGRSDLFSLGVTLYQLLTGQLPFRADSMATLMFKITNEAPTPLGVVRPDLPETLAEIIERALDKDPDARFQSGAEMAVTLRECVTELAA